MKRIICVLCAFILAGCSGHRGTDQSGAETEAVSVYDGILLRESMDKKKRSPAPVLVEVDLSNFFRDVRGCAVFYEPDTNQYTYYNPELWEYESSPCSTFKIISALMGVEHGVIDTADSVRAWDQEVYWNKDWNRDIDLKEAFRVSCIWYFRDVIDALGPDLVQADLDRLGYGNRDISDWQGLQNVNNNNLRLRGFWVESSLRISPRRQVEVLSRIFETGLFSPEAVDMLREVMRSDGGSGAVTIYGKTGMGVKNGRCVDAWYVGFYETAAGSRYFAVRLDDPDNPLADSKKAREIAETIIMSREAG